MSIAILRLVNGIISLKNLDLQRVRSVLNKGLVKQLRNLEEHRKEKKKRKKEQLEQENLSNQVDQASQQVEVAVSKAAGVENLLRVKLKAPAVGKSGSKVSSSRGKKSVQPKKLTSKDQKKEVNVKNVDYQSENSYTERSQQQSEDQSEELELSRRKSQRGVELASITDVKKMSAQVSESDFSRQLPNSQDLTDFYKQAPVPQLSEFPDIPIRMQDPFMMLNLARTNPQLFAKSYMESFKLRYVASEGFGGYLDTYMSLDKTKAIRMKEGLQAIDECIQKLKKMEPVGPLRWDMDLHYASRDHCQDIGQLGIYGHEGSTGLNMYDRLKSYTDLVPGMLAENVIFGTQNPMEALILMLIDDGDYERKMRKNLLDPCHKFFGLAVGKHISQEGMCTAMMCLEYLNKQKVKQMHYFDYD